MKFLIKILNAYLFTIVSLFGLRVLAWGKQGHAIVNQTAALLLSEETKYDFLREHAFDLAYFSNVPDIVWKQQKTYDLEAPQHFMDMEIFERELKINANSSTQLTEKMNEAFLLQREEFDAKYPNITLKAGRSWWRIREIYDLFQKQSQFLADSKMTQKERHDLQAHWLVLAGVLGHYVGDLAQPLHCTENFDGQLSGQKGLHSFFEDKLLNLMIPKLSEETLKEAKKIWPIYSREAKKLSTLTLISELTHNSRAQLKKLLALDKKLKRKNIKSIATQYRPMIIRQLAEGAVTLAELMKRNLDWKFNSHSFYSFYSMPEYINPGTEKSSHIEEVIEDKSKE